MLTRVQLNQYELVGVINFTNAVKVEQEGKALLKNSIASKDDFFTLSLSQLESGDSSVLAVLLSWARFLKKQKVGFCVKNIPPSIQALAQMCEVDQLLFQS